MAKPDSSLELSFQLRVTLFPDKEAENEVGFAIGSFFQEPESDAAFTFELTLTRLQTITELSRRKETFVSEYF